MTIAYWCVLVVVLLPYFLSLAARSAASRREYIGDPRSYSDTLTGWRRRAHLAHLNAFEATPALLAGIVVAQFAQAPREHIDVLAVLFTCLRLIHALLYIADRPQLRSHAWRLGIMCVIAMFIDAAVWGRR
jgi:uncharacterized MAPEG superfamily protein